MDSRTRSIVSLRVVPAVQTEECATGMLSSVVGSLIIAIAALGLMADDSLVGTRSVYRHLRRGWAGCQVDSIG